MFYNCFGAINFFAGIDVPFDFRKLKSKLCDDYHKTERLNGAKGAEGKM